MPGGLQLAQAIATDLDWKQDLGEGIFRGVRVFAGILVWWNFMKQPFWITGELIDQPKQAFLRNADTYLRGLWIAFDCNAFGVPGLPAYSAVRYF